MSGSDEACLLSVLSRGPLASWNANLPLAIKCLPDLGFAVTVCVASSFVSVRVGLSLTPRPPLHVAAPLRREPLPVRARPRARVRGCRAHGAADPVTLPTGRWTGGVVSGDGF